MLDSLVVGSERAAAAWQLAPADEVRSIAPRQGLGYIRVKRDFTRVKRIYHPLNLDGGRNWNHPGEMSIHPPNSSPPPQITPLVPYRYLRYYMYR